MISTDGENIDKYRWLPPGREEKGGTKKDDGWETTHYNFPEGSTRNKDAVQSVERIRRPLDSDFVLRKTHHTKDLGTNYHFKEIAKVFRALTRQKGEFTQVKSETKNGIADNRLKNEEYLAAFESDCETIEALRGDTFKRMSGLKSDLEVKYKIFQESTDHADELRREAEDIVFRSEERVTETEKNIEETINEVKEIESTICKIQDKYVDKLGMLISFLESFFYALIFTIVVLKTYELYLDSSHMEDGLRGEPTYTWDMPHMLSAALLKAYHVYFPEMTFFEWTVLKLRNTLLYLSTVEFTISPFSWVPLVLSI